MDTGLIQGLAEAIDRRRGSVTGGLGLLNYTPEAERSMGSLPSITTHRLVQQNADGTIAFAPDPLGTGALIPGRYWVNEWGRYVAY